MINPPAIHAIFFILLSEEGKSMFWVRFFGRAAIIARAKNVEIILSAMDTKILEEKTETHKFCPIARNAAVNMSE